jgi:hypothetical protein
MRTAPGPADPDPDVTDTSATSAENIHEAVVEAPQEVSHASGDGPGAAGGDAPREGPAPSHSDLPPALSGDASPGTVGVPSEDVNMADPTERDTERTRTDEERAADDAALLATGEPVAGLSEIAPMLGVSTKTLRWVVHREGGPLIRYVSSPRPVRFCIADVRAAVEAARPEIEDRRRRAEAIEAAERARAEAARSAKVVAPKKTTRVTAPAKLRPVAPAPISATRSKAGPEVLVVRRPRSG